MTSFLGRISLLALALAGIGVAPAGASLLGPVPGLTLAQPLSAPHEFEAAALKCKHKNNCKKHKKKNQQNNNGPGQVPDNPKPKNDKNNPKGGNHPPVVVFKPVNRPGGICIGGRIIKQRCRCQANEVREAIGKGIFACRQNKTTARATPVSSVASVAAAQQARTPAVAEFAPNEVLLTFPLNNVQQIEDQVAAAYNLEILQRAEVALLGRRIIRCRISGNRPVSAVLAALQGDGRITASQPNYYYRRQATPQGETSSSIQYALEKLGIAAAHAVATGLGSLIAIIDTGIDQSHPDLQAAVTGRFDATEARQQVSDPHGTAIAGIITAHGAIEGVAPQAKLLDVRVFEPEAGGAGSIASTMALLRGLQWSTDAHARIVNLSLAGPRDGLMGEAIAAMIAKDIVIVAAAGNAGAAAPNAYPAAFADVIAVTATDSGDALYASANHGSYIAVAAPGVDVIAPALYEAYQMNSGTSFAAAHVSGVIALMLEHDPKLSNRKIRDVLQSGAKDLGPPGPDEQFGAGRVNALAVLQ
ncbi:MAG: S8 family serine peptidase [Aestuariivirga sp.]